MNIKLESEEILRMPSMQISEAGLALNYVTTVKGFGRYILQGTLLRELVIGRL